MRFGKNDNCECTNWQNLRKLWYNSIKLITHKLQMSDLDGKIDNITLVYVNNLDEKTDLKLFNVGSGLKYDGSTLSVDTINANSIYLTDGRDVESAITSLEDEIGDTDTAGTLRYNEQNDVINAEYYGIHNESMLQDGFYLRKRNDEQVSVLVTDYDPQYFAYKDGKTTLSDNTKNALIYGSSTSFYHIYGIYLQQLYFNTLNGEERYVGDLIKYAYIINSENITYYTDSLKSAYRITARNNTDDSIVFTFECQIGLNSYDESVGTHYYYGYGIQVNDNYKTIKYVRIDSNSKNIFMSEDNNTFSSLNLGSYTLAINYA